MKSVVSIIFIGLFFGCIQTGTSTNIGKETKILDSKDSAHCTIDSNWLNPSTSSYVTVLDSLSKLKAHLKKRYLAASSDSLKNAELMEASVIMETWLVSKVFPHWYGTPWDFNGYTNKPNKGTVACGYFVSTTLKHAGLTINRYKLAQQNPKNEALTLALKESIITITSTVDSSGITRLKHMLKPGLYFVGLDSHVGFLWQNTEGLFFIHSNYYGESVVTIECVDYSEAFKSSQYLISPISTNRHLLKSWLLGEEVVVKVED